MSRPRARFVMMPTAATAVTVAASGLASDPQPVASSVETRTVEIPGTVETIELARVPMDNGRDLWVSTTEVTWDIYDVYLYGLDVPEGDPDAEAVTRPSKPYVPPDRGMGHAGFPAMGMTRQAAESFCEWFEVKTGLAARLPTEAEFERLAGTDPAMPIGEVAWTAENSDGTTRRVAQKPANAFGLHDTLGNVAEWVAGEGVPRAMGGSYLDDEAGCTPASVQRQARSWNQSDPQIPKSRWWLADCSWVGFRIVIEEPRDE